jgi:hypothetical protein
MAQDDEKIKYPKLDGTFGVGTMTEVKVYVRIPNSDQMREETFTVPYLFLDLSRMTTMHMMNLFAGFSLINEGKPNQLKELGL